MGKQHPPFPAHQVEAQNLRPQGLAPGLGHAKGGQARGAIVQAHGDAAHLGKGPGQEEDGHLPPVEEVAGQPPLGQGLQGRLPAPAQEHQLAPKGLGRHPLGGKPPKDPDGEARGAKGLLHLGFRQAQGLLHPGPQVGETPP